MAHGYFDDSLALSKAEQNNCLACVSEDAKTKLCVNEDDILPSPSATVKYKILSGEHMAQRNDEGSSVTSEAE